jgi:hypothetical protein
MWNKIKDFMYSRTGAGLLCLCNAYFCAVNISQGAWLWGGIAGFFALLMGEQWVRLGRKF